MLFTLLVLLGLSNCRKTPDRALDGYHYELIDYRAHGENRVNDFDYFKFDYPKKSKADLKLVQIKTNQNFGVVEKGGDTLANMLGVIGENTFNEQAYITFYQKIRSPYPLSKKEPNWDGSIEIFHNKGRFTSIVNFRIDEKNDKLYIGSYGQANVPIDKILVEKYVFKRTKL